PGLSPWALVCAYDGLPVLGDDLIVHECASGATQGVDKALYQYQDVKTFTGTGPGASPGAVTLAERVG
ncbi:hypothetical protein ABZ554_22855, partial [Streptomyces sp. NPDC020125]